jgi:cellulose synthase/poly-beta-1,6-N-acetylglucosamine synthase-like glycosyltransferase
MIGNMSENMKYEPLISVIMPIRNESEFVERSLKAIVAQDYPSEKLEIIVVDGNSDDGSQEKVRKLISDNRNLKMQLLKNEKKIFSKGFNIGLRSAAGDVIFMIGGHTIIERDYLRKCLEYLEKEDAVCVGGVIETVGKDIESEAIAVGMSSLFGIGNVKFRLGNCRQVTEVDTVAFGAYRRDVFQKFGFIDEELVRNQDDELNYRIRKLGGKILLSPDIKSRYYSRSSLKKLWKQYFQYGFWKVRVLQKHPYQMSLRQFVPPAFVLSLILFGLLALVSAGAKVLFAAVLISYILANLTASVVTAAQRGWKHLPFLPSVFAILHVSYGLGFITGLLRFANRWGDKGLSENQST